MAGSAASANPGEFTPSGSAPLSGPDGRTWGIVTKNTPGTKGVGSTANGKGGEFHR